MDFLAFQTAVLDQRFGSGRRTTIKRKINSAIAKTWASYPWAFKRKRALSVSIGYDATMRNYVLTPSEPIEEILGVFDENGNPLTPLANDKFEETYESVTDHGTPESFTIYGEGSCLALRFGPAPDEAKTYKVAYNRAAPTLSADGDDLATYGWPAQHHEIVVVETRIAMLRDENDPTWRELAPERDELLGAMIDALVADDGGTTKEFGADPLALEV